MIKRLYVDNYKCLVDFTLEFDNPLTLLLGRNGAGKTAVLDVLFALQSIIRDQSNVSAAVPNTDMTRWHNRNRQIFELEVEVDHAQFIYRLETARGGIIELERLSVGDTKLLEVKVAPEDKTKNELWVLVHTPTGEEFLRKNWTWPREASGVRTGHDKQLDADPRINDFHTFIERMMICSLQPARFEAVSRSDDRYLGRSVANFANWYRNLIMERTLGIEVFEKDLREVLDGLDGFKRINFPKDPGDVSRLLLFEFEDRGKGVNFRFDELSDGQRALVVLYSLLHLGKNQVSALFLDEPENFLALSEIQPWLGALEEACGEAIPQVVLSSHHPEFMDYLGQSSGVLLERPEGGATIVRSASTVPVDETGLKFSEIVARGWESDP